MEWRIEGGSEWSWLSHGGVVRSFLELMAALVGGVVSVAPVENYGVRHQRDLDKVV